MSADDVEELCHMVFVGIVTALCVGTTIFGLAMVARAFMYGPWPTALVSLPFFALATVSGMLARVLTDG